MGLLLLEAGHPVVGTDQSAGVLARALVIVLALLFLLVRPQGLFGEKIIDRV